MIKKLLLFCLIFTGISNYLNAQESAEIIGRISDAKSRLPIVFATIQLKNAKNGVIADEDGFFRLPLHYKAEKEILIISSIGYATKRVPVSELKENITNNIRLQPKVESLGEVTIVAQKNKKNYISADAIVFKAIQKINSNYPKTPHSYIGYYRDYQLLHNKYTNLNEGIMEVFDAGFSTDKLNDGFNQTALYSFKTNDNFEKDSTITVPYDNKGRKFIKYSTISPLGGNELSILDVHNPVRNFNKPSFSFIYVFKDDFVQNHEFKIRNVHYLDDIPLYEISFTANKKVTGIKNSAKGTIYVSKYNYAIHKLEYYGFKANETDPFYTIKIEYIPKGKHMFLNYISFNNYFQVRSNDDFKITDITFDKTLNSFYFTFNNAVNKASITNKKNYRFIYKRKKLSIGKIERVEPNVLKISLVKGAISDGELTKDEDIKNLKYKIKNLVDTSNRKLNKVTVIDINQFRELFVQEVFPNRPLPLRNMKFVDKTAPLSKAGVNTVKGKSKYWINTPLKATKH